MRTDSLTRRAKCFRSLALTYVYMFLLALRTTVRHFQPVQRLTYVHNTCIAKYVDGVVMDGWWIQGKLVKGLLQGTDHSEYHGEFEDGKFDGKGFFKYPDGSTYLGTWEVYRAGWRECRGTERQVDRRQGESRWGIRA